MYSINQNSRPGRKPLLDEAKRREICEVLAVGGTRTMAAAYVGCSLDTIARTARRDTAFAKQLRRASVECEIRCLRSLHNAAQDPKDWRAAAWTLERLYPERYGRRARSQHDPQVRNRPLRALGALGGKRPAERHRRNSQTAVPAMCETASRQLQNRPAKNVKSSGKTRPSAPAVVIRSSAPLTATPQNSGRESRIIIEKNAVVAPSALVAVAPPENAAPQNHPPLGKKTQYPSKESPPRLVKVGQNSKKSFSARLRKIAPRHRSSAESLVAGARHGTCFWRGPFSRDSWHWLASARNWNIALRQFLLHVLRKKASHWGGPALNSGESSHASDQLDDRYADCLLPVQVPSVWLPARKSRSSSCNSGEPP